MSLVEYRRKREFSRTREPAPGRVRVPGDRAIFVVQLHHASRRHYDFRLQVGGVLRSWAVPKGPSFDPAVKRMAVEVEDHPLDYAGFEGDIPKGQYGGGHVAVFDAGYWSTDGDVQAQLAKGHLRFELFGDKLKGGWHLVRSGKPGRQVQWLLFKDKDGYAGPLEADDLLGNVTPAPTADVQRAGAGKRGKAQRIAAPAAKARRRRDWAKRALQLPGASKARFLGGFFAPQLAQLGDAPPEGPAWLHELKWDGYRLLVTVVDGKARLYSRNALDWTPKLPDIVAAIEALKLGHAALDGELIAGSGTKADFNLLQATLSGGRTPTCRWSCSICCTWMASTSPRRRCSSARRCCRPCWGRRQRTSPTVPTCWARACAPGSWPGNRGSKASSPKRRARMAFIGLESLNEKSLQGVRKNQNKVEEFKEAFNELHRRGILTFAGYMFALEGDTQEYYEHAVREAGRSGCRRYSPLDRHTSVRHPLVPAGGG